MAPRVTVAIPVYNGEAFLSRALDSVLSQTFGDFEALIVDDGSTDGTQEVLAVYSDSRIRILRNEENSGLAFTRNRLLDEARGEYLAWLDADDACAAERLATQVQFLDSAPEVIMCATWCTVRAAGSENVPTIGAPSVSGPLLAASQLLWNEVSTSSVMLRLGPVRMNSVRFEESLAPAEDYGFWFNLAGLGRIEIIPQVLTERWELESGASRSNRDRQAAGARQVRARAVRLAVPAATTRDLELHELVFRGSLSGTPRGDLSDAARWIESLASKAPSDGRYSVADSQLVGGAALLRLARINFAAEPALAIGILARSPLRWHAMKWMRRQWLRKRKATARARQGWRTG